MSWLLVAVAASLNFGSYWQGGVWLIVLATVLVYIPRPRPRPDFWTLAVFGAVFNLAATLRVPTWLHRPPEWAPPWVVTAEVVALVAVCLYGPLARTPLVERITRWRFPLLLLAVGCESALALVAVPDPLIDVFYFMNEGVRGLVQGLNPYAMQFTTGVRDYSVGYQDPNYHFDVYSYLPGTLVLSLPALVLGDVRWVMLGSTLLAALGLRRLGHAFRLPGEQVDLFAATFLCYPGLLHVMLNAWAEPLIVCLWVAALLSWFAQPARPRLAAACAGLALTVKQYAPPLLLPLLAAGMTRRQALVALVFPVAVSLPFFLWGPGDFFWDAFWYQIQAPMRDDALSLNGYLMNEWRLSLPGWLTVAAPLAGAAYIVEALLQARSFAIVLTRTVGMYLVLLLFNKFAFANYYFMVEAVLVVAVAATCAPELAALEAARSVRSGKKRCWWPRLCPSR